MNMPAKISLFLLVDRLATRFALTTMPSSRRVADSRAYSALFPCKVYLLVSIKHHSTIYSVWQRSEVYHDHAPRGFLALHQQRLPTGAFTRDREPGGRRLSALQVWFGNEKEIPFTAISLFGF